MNELMKETTQEIWQNLTKSYPAGVLIGISGIVYLSCSNKIIGAFLFSFGLLTICELGLKLFTGMAGFTKGFENYCQLGIAWCGNFFGASSVKILCAVAYPEIMETCQALCAVKIEDTMQVIFIKGFLCGIMMFLAVYMYRNREGLAKYLWIILCVPIFILSGFEHSIADIFYFSGSLSAIAWLYLLLVSIANVIGAKVANVIFIQQGDSNGRNAKNYG